MNQALAPIAALLLSVSILLTGQGLQGVLVPVRASIESFSTVSIGAMGAVYFIGFTLGCLRGVQLVQRVGHVRVFLAMTALASSLPLIHSLVIDSVIWLFLRFLTGFCFALLYVVIESWLNEVASNDNRGLIFSTYSLVSLAVLGLGQMLLLFDDPAGTELFIIASVLVSLGAIPIALSRSRTPEEPVDIKVDLPHLFRIAPSGAAGCLAAGCANGAFWGLGPVYASNLGGTGLAATFMTAAVIGGAVAQWPIGILSDYAGRRKLIGVLGIGLGAIGLAIFVGSTALATTTALVLAAAWGALAFPLYTVAVAYANDHASPAEFVMMSSGLLLLYGIGASIGPFIATAMISDTMPAGLFLFTSLVHVGLVVFIVGRYLVSGEAAEQSISYRDALSFTQTASPFYEEECEQEAEAEAEAKARAASAGE